MLPGSDIITHSSFSTFQACRRRYFYAYEQGWRPQRTPAAMLLGQAVHRGLHSLAEGAALDEALPLIEHVYEEEILKAVDWPDADSAVYKLELASVTAQCLAAGYAEAWGNSRLEIIGSEQPFNLPLINPATGRSSRLFRQAGKRDRLVRLPDGRTARAETKTCGQDIGPNSDYRRVLALNQQLSMYMNADRAEGIDVETTLYDVIRRPTIQPTKVDLQDEDGCPIVLDKESGERVLKANGEPRKTGDTKKGYVVQRRRMSPDEWANKLGHDIQKRPEYYYDRFEVSRLEDDLETFRQELWQIAKDMNDCRRAGYWYRRTASCRDYNHLCSHYAICAGEVDISDGCPAGFRQAEYAHEELCDDG